MADHITSYIRDLQIDVALDGLTVSVGPGVCFIPVPKRISSDGTAQVTLSSPTVNTWYHVYGFRGTGTSLAIEVVTTAPSTPYRGAARTKTGDTTRRYLGSMYVGSDGKIRPFKNTQVGSYGNKILFDATSSAGSIPLRILNIFSSNTATTISLNPIVPATSMAAIVQVTNMSNQMAYVSRPGLPAPSATNFQFCVMPNESGTADVMLNSSQQMTLVLSATNLLGAIISLVLTGSVNVYAHGYYFDR